MGNHWLNPPHPHLVWTEHKVVSYALEDFLNPGLYFYKYGFKLQHTKAHGAPLQILSLAEAQRVSGA